ncbi:hypothetical protein [Paenibacillus sp. HW567]|uniref:hypothetical protein n=1 Tax=Paenibacillus sp. HW567 TaxID=1034769 RepID=UPI00036ABCF4|nr:hypothetical protein [Paenibacillus sp. HW567]
MYIQTKAPQTIHIMYGTVLKVNGQLVHPDPGDSWFSAEYNRRTGHYTGIPAKAVIEINPGSYGVLDPSGDVSSC